MSEKLYGWLIATTALGIAVGLSAAFSLTATNTFLLQMLVVAISTWYAGTGAGLAVITLSVFFNQVFLMPPTLSFRIEDPSDLIRLVLFLGASVIVSMWARSEKQARRLTRKLAEANSAKEEMMAMLAHDLRAPLTAILGWAALKRSGKLEEPELVQKAFDAIERNGRQQLELMETLLDVSRIRSGRIQLEWRRCDLMRVLSDAIETIRPGAESKQLRLEHQCEIPSVSVEADPGRLRQVFLNLMSNAVKYTPEKGRVEVLCRRSDDHVEVQVADTGRGIEPDLLPHIFEPFRHGLGQDVGAGLGLAIARELVELHGGQIQAESEGIGKGSRFTVKLPSV